VNPRIVLALTLVCVAALGGLVLVARSGDDEGGTSSAAEPQGARLPDGVRAPALALTDERGRRVTMARFRGRPLIVTFVYSHCEETCPTQVQTIKGAIDQLGRDVPALAIAVDPPNDTPRSGAAFLSKQRMLGRMTFAVGSRAELRPVWRGYAIQPQTARDEHQGRIVLVDGRGFQRIGYPLEQATPERLASDYRLLERGYPSS
jgi:protein SCO1/2